MPKTIYKKDWIKSKTLWFNALVIIAGVTTWAAGEVQAGATITFAGIMNTILRIITNEGVSF
jgi:hypothetical protein